MVFVFEILIIAHVVKFFVFLANTMAQYRVQKGLHVDAEPEKPRPHHHIRGAFKF